MSSRYCTFASIVSVSCLTFIGCGPSQDTLDRFKEVSARSSVDSIQLPESTLDVPSASERGSYSVEVESSGSLRPSMSESNVSPAPSPTTAAAPNFPAPSSTVTPALPSPSIVPPVQTQEPPTFAAPSLSPPNLQGPAPQNTPELSLPPTLSPPTASTGPVGSGTIKPVSAGLIPPPTITKPTAPKPLDSGKLDIGDVAPPLAIAQWAKGDPIEGFQPGKVYVVEFWATWCGPCKMNMPHLSTLQQQYGDDVRIIGISDEKLSTLQNFFAQRANSSQIWDEVLTYNIALDDQQATKIQYLRAAGERSIPCAFIVGKSGIVEWIGHPGGMDEPLAAIVAGNWDVNEARTQRKEKKAFQVALRAAQNRLRIFLPRAQYEPALEVIESLATEFPKQEQPLWMKLEVLRKSEKFDDTYKVIEDISRRQWDNANVIGQLSWLISAETQGPGRDLKLSLKLAERCLQLAGEENAMALDTLARANYENGDYAKAVALQTKAVQGAVAAGDRYAPEMQKALEKYEAAIK